MSWKDRNIVSKKSKKKRVLSLTKEQRVKMWDDEGPYSEACLVFETRILDDEISRIFLKVEVSINPLTFETIKKNRKSFADNKRIQDILEYAEHRFEERGYEATLFSVPYERDMLETANEVLKEVEEAITKMHKFVMNQFDISVN